MRSPGPRIGLTLLLVVAFAAFFAVFMHVYSSLRRARTTALSAVTALELANQQCAITNFFAASGRWPTSYSELVRNPLGMVFITPEPTRDRWGGYYRLDPYNSTAGYGRVLSYGHDRKPGGTNEDADVELRFP